MEWLFKYLHGFKWYQQLLNWSSKVILPGFGGLPLYTVTVFFFTELKKQALATKASALAFNFLLAIFPFIIFLFTLIPLLPIENFQTKLLLILQQILPFHTFRAAQSTIEDILQETKLDLLSLGFISAMYFSTNGISTLMNAFNKSSLQPETRKFFRKQWVALSLTVMMVLLLIVAASSIIFSELLIGWLQKEHVIEGGLVIFSLQTARWLIIAGLYLLAVSVLYYFGPSKHKMWHFITPGSILATLLAILSSIGFAYYISNFGTYNKLYGSIGTLIVIMLWLYINSLILLIGFELNASIELSKRSIKLEPRGNTLRN